jgi:hypothetical protein
MQQQVHDTEADSRGMSSCYIFRYTDGSLRYFTRPSINELNVTRGNYSGRFAFIRLELVS